MKITSGLLAGLIIAFVHSWLVTLLILLLAPVLVVTMTLQAKLVVGTGGTSKKAYEQCGKVRKYTLTSNILYLSFSFRLPLSQYTTYARW